MCKLQEFKALVNERLSAAAEEICVLFEKTIAEYEGELRHCKEDNQRNREVPLRIELIRGNVPSPSPGDNLNLKITEIAHIEKEKGEQSVKREEEELLVPTPESSVVCVKSEDSSPFQQTQGEDTSPLLHFYSSDTANDDYWEPHSSPVQLETEITDQVQIRDKDTKQTSQNWSVAEMSVTVGYGGSNTKAEWKTHQCSVCQKTFCSLAQLQRHLQVHAGVKSYSCSFCEKTFTRKSGLDVHMNSHTGEKLYSCSICEKTFLHKSSQSAHMTVHTGEKLYNCSMCMKSFTRQTALLNHKLIHTGPKFKCSLCKKEFTQRSNLGRHMRTHTGENPYSCSICNQVFVQKPQLLLHLRTHGAI